jgi:NADH:ubiquinone oxidoreductase subunit 2 (subunit N)
MQVDIVTIVPEIIILVAACLVLLVEPFLKADKTVVMAISLTGLIASAAVSLGLVGQERLSFNGMLVLSD